MSRDPFYERGYFSDFLLFFFLLGYYFSVIFDFINVVSLFLSDFYGLE
jgi:hypothetical protein